MELSNLQLAVRNMREWTRVQPIAGLLINTTVMLGGYTVAIWSESIILSGIAILFALVATRDVANWLWGVLK
jgi:hypothetical protein